MKYIIRYIAYYYDTRHNIIIAHYVCGGLFDERFAVTNGLGPLSIEMLLSTISTSPFGSRFIIGRLLYVCRTYMGRVHSRRSSNQKYFFFPNGKSLHVRISVIGSTLFTIDTPSTNWISMGLVIRI